MNQLKLLKLLFVRGWMICLCSEDAQTLQRNLLSRFSEQDIAQALTLLPQWHPFPQTIKEWQEILPDTILEKIYGQAEKYATMPFEPLSASLMLEYIRTQRYTSFIFGHDY